MNQPYRSSRWRLKAFFVRRIEHKDLAQCLFNSTEPARSGISNIDSLKNVFHGILIMVSQLWSVE